MYTNFKIRTRTNAMDVVLSFPVLAPSPVPLISFLVSPITKLLAMMSEDAVEEPLGYRSCCEGSEATCIGFVLHASLVPKTTRRYLWLV